MEGKNNIMEQKKIFTLEQAREHFRKNKFVITNQELGCIDDRDERERIAIPGGSLGYYMAVMASLDNLGITPDEKQAEELCNMINSVVGGCIHTDEKSVEKHDPLQVAGCGHCSGILKRNELSPFFSDFLKNHYLAKMESEMKEPVIYKGSHEAKAVFVINDLETGIVSNDGENKAFVYNKAYDEKLTKDLTKTIFPFIQKIKPSLTEDEFSQIVEKTKADQLKKTLDHLTLGLPYFDSKDLA